MVSFFFNDTATTEIYTLSLHDALPIWILLVDVEDELGRRRREELLGVASERLAEADLRRHRVLGDAVLVDRKSTRLNSSHANISYAVFCLKKTTQFQVRHAPRYSQLPG